MIQTCRKITPCILLPGSVSFPVSRLYISLEHLSPFNPSSVLPTEGKRTQKKFIFTLSSHTKSIIHGTRYHIIINSISFKNQDPYIHILIQSHVSKSISHNLKIFPVMAGGDKGRPSKKHKSSSAKVLQITLLMLFERDFGFFLIGLKLGFFVQEDRRATVVDDEDAYYAEELDDDYRGGMPIYLILFSFCCLLFRMWIELIWMSWVIEWLKNDWNWYLCRRKEERL